MSKGPWRSDGDESALRIVAHDHLVRAFAQDRVDQRADGRIVVGNQHAPVPLGHIGLPFALENPSASLAGRVALVNFYFMTRPVPGFSFPVAAILLLAAGARAGSRRAGDRFAGRRRSRFRRPAGERRVARFARRFDDRDGSGNAARRAGGLLARANVPPALPQACSSSCASIGVSTGRLGHHDSRCLRQRFAGRSVACGARRQRSGHACRRRRCGVFRLRFVRRDCLDGGFRRDGHALRRCRAHARRERMAHLFARRAALPLPSNVAAGIAFAWLRAIGEYGATSIVAYHPTSLPVALYVALSASGVRAALALTYGFVVLAVAVLACSGFCAVAS